MHIETISEPTEPLYEESDAEILSALRVDLTDDQAESVNIKQSIAGAVGFVETYLRKRLLTQVVEVTLDGFPRGHIESPLPLVQSIEAINYIDQSGDTLTLSAENYRPLKSGHIMCVSSTGWPATIAQPEAVTVRLTVGYGETRDSVPDDILTAVRMMAAHLFENAEATVIDVSADTLPLGVEDLLRPHRFWF